MISRFNVLCFLQENRNRYYKVENCEVMLKSNTIEVLKMWDMQYPTIIYDRKYLKELAKDVFGLECLAKSSVGGTPSRNGKKQHAPLNPTKLKFMRGKYLISYFHFAKLLIYVLLLQIYSTVVLETSYLDQEDSRQ